jgi:hypothetical protein
MIPLFFLVRGNSVTIFYSTTNSYIRKMNPHVRRKIQRDERSYILSSVIAASQVRVVQLFNNYVLRV